MQKDIFFVSPFGEENSDRRKKSDSIFTQLESIFNNLEIPEDYIFKNYYGGIEFKIERSDHMHDVDIVKTMLEQLEKAHLVIVDITGLNPNVMYELGIRIGKEKPVLVIRPSNESTELPFNLRGVRYISFDLSTEANLKKFQDELRENAESFLKDQSQFIYKKSKLIYKIENEDLDLLTEKKAKCKGNIKMSWIMREWDSKNLFNYFNQEKEILEKNRISANRLINTTNLKKKNIIKHVMIYKTLIQTGQYRIYSTDREDSEILIYHKIEESQINENVGFVLFPDSTQQENSLGLIIYDQNIINAIDNRYNNDRKNGLILKIKENYDDRKIKNTVKNWIKESNKKFNGHI